MPDISDDQVVRAVSGTTIFLFTDVEGSTRLWQENEAGMHRALARHNEVLEGSPGEDRQWVAESLKRANEANEAWKIMFPPVGCCLRHRRSWRS